MSKRARELGSFLDQEIELFETAGRLNRRHVYAKDGVSVKRGSGLKSCGKTKYKDREQAKHALFIIKTKRHSGIYVESKRRETRSYFCVRCHSWHLSSKKDQFNVEVADAKVA